MQNTPEVVLYIATSLDGFIATPTGGLNWLERAEQEGQDYGYKDFYNSVDALIMGQMAYEQILGYDQWPYSGKSCWVFGQSLSSGAKEPDGVCVVNDHPAAFLAGLARSGVKKAWLVGGGNLVSSFANHQLISEYVISVAPVILGRGVPLFSGPGIMQNLRLEGSKNFDSGLVQMRYRHVPKMAQSPQELSALS